ncbi:hypothetical protein LTS18_002752 [Coniosporium uncinatum]|uniref:Uncharacterized protein n=1 Tax=Coniosporium uncinatum TaxID=93489 RepID=A0ACC3DU93_9PEZI|nr:hypothetical protein LTS18_002752 [Coniosporium uncinatum]
MSEAARKAATERLRAHIRAQNAQRAQQKPELSRQSVPVKREDGSIERVLSEPTVRGPADRNWRSGGQEIEYLDSASNENSITPPIPRKVGTLLADDDDDGISTTVPIPRSFGTLVPTTTLSPSTNHRNNAGEGPSHPRCTRAPPLRDPSLQIGTLTPEQWRAQAEARARQTLDEGRAFQNAAADRDAQSLSLAQALQKMEEAASVKLMQRLHVKMNGDSPAVYDATALDGQLARDLQGKLNLEAEAEGVRVPRELEGVRGGWVGVTEEEESERVARRLQKQLDEEVEEE